MNRYSFSFSSATITIWICDKDVADAAMREKSQTQNVVTLSLFENDLKESDSLVGGDVVWACHINLNRSFRLLQLIIVNKSKRNLSPISTNTTAKYRSRFSKA